MNFYYDPILGLVYKEINSFIELDLTAIPEIQDYEKFMNMWSSLGITILRTPIVNSRAINTTPKITTYFIPL